MGSGAESRACEVGDGDRRYHAERCRCGASRVASWANIMACRGAVGLCCRHDNYFERCEGTCRSGGKGAGRRAWVDEIQLFFILGAIAGAHAKILAAPFGDDHFADKEINITIGLDKKYHNIGAEDIKTISGLNKKDRIIAPTGRQKHQQENKQNPDDTVHQMVSTVPVTIGTAGAEDSTDSHDYHDRPRLLNGPQDLSPDGIDQDHGDHGVEDWQEILHWLAQQPPLVAPIPPDLLAVLPPNQRAGWRADMSLAVGSTIEHRVALADNITLAHSAMPYGLVNQQLSLGPAGVQGLEGLEGLEWLRFHFINRLVDYYERQNNKPSYEIANDAGNGNGLPQGGGNIAPREDGNLPDPTPHVVILPNGKMVWQENAGGRQITLQGSIKIADLLGNLQDGDNLLLAKGSLLTGKPQEMLDLLSMASVESRGGYILLDINVVTDKQIAMFQQHHLDGVIVIYNLDDDCYYLLDVHSWALQDKIDASLLLPAIPATPAPPAPPATAMQQVLQPLLVEDMMGTNHQGSQDNLPHGPQDILAGEAVLHVPLVAPLPLVEPLMAGRVPPAHDDSQQDGNITSTITGNETAIYPALSPMVDLVPSIIPPQDPFAVF